MLDLTVEHVTKRYRVQRMTRTDGRRRTLVDRLRVRADDFWALRDVSFDVARGETLGIIGHNGAGKSTILKLLSSVTAPTSGEIRIHGRLSALIEVGSGFHPELTGRENIYLSGSILGMRRREIVDKLDRIIEFAGVRDFIDTPVKHYSSGMYVRLGFSIAAHLEPDILLLDEVLAVGDAAFQAKCLDRIHELHRQGRTIVFISHDLASVERLCARVLLLSHGRVIASGPSREVIATYQDIGCRQALGEAGVEADPTLSQAAKIISATCCDEDEKPTTVLRTGARAKVSVQYLAQTAVPDAIVEVYCLSVVGGSYLPWCQLTTVSKDGEGILLPAGRGRIEFDVDHLSLMPGMYYFSVAIMSSVVEGLAIDRVHQCLTLRVDEGRPIRGSFSMPHRWHHVVSETAAARADEPVEWHAPAVPQPHPNV
jgi:ABC-type polysaccharide/polyol phosphate transport system ATPase subunit